MEEKEELLTQSEDPAAEGADEAPAAEEPGANEEEETATEELARYEEMARSDLAAIVALRPEYAACRHLGELPFAGRFAELRELGLSCEEALAAADRTPHTRGSKNHLHSVLPRTGGERISPAARRDLAAAREIFGERLSEKELADLYRRATR